MPYKSKKQERYMHAAEKRGDISKKVVDEFDAASKGKKLPESADGSHEQSHKQIPGSARKHIHTGAPSEQRKSEK
jgi:hypothetical protein